MVKVDRGTVLTCDTTINRYLSWLQENGSRLGIIHRLDDTHLFVQPDSVPLIQKKIDELMKQNTFPVGQTNNLSGKD